MGKLYGVFLVLWWCSCTVSAQTYGGITVEGAKCGQKTCKVNEYCSSYHNNCQDCGEVCNTSSHNYEVAICEKQCQDYLHDLRYVRLSGGNQNDLRGTVDKLSRMVTITLTIVVFMLLVLACLLTFQLYRWKVKKNITLASIKSKLFKKNNSTTTAQTNDQDHKKRDLRIEIPSPTINSDHSPVTVTTSIDRRPAEDSTLDYAYDNPAMTKSPNSSY